MVLIELIRSVHRTGHSPSDILQARQHAGDLRKGNTSPASEWLCLIVEAQCIARGVEIEMEKLKDPDTLNQWLSRSFDDQTYAFEEDQGWRLWCLRQPRWSSRLWQLRDVMKWTLKSYFHRLASLRMAGSLGVGHDTVRKRHVQACREGAQEGLRKFSKMNAVDLRSVPSVFYDDVQLLLQFLIDCRRGHGPTGSVTASLDRSTDSLMDQITRQLRDISNDEPHSRAARLFAMVQTSRTRYRVDGDVEDAASGESSSVTSEVTTELESGCPSQISRGVALARDPAPHHHENTTEWNVGHAPVSAPWHSVPPGSEEQICNRHPISMPGTPGEYFSAEIGF